MDKAYWADFIEREEARLADVEERVRLVKEHLEGLRQYVLAQEAGPDLLDAIQALAVELELTRALDGYTKRRIVAIRRHLES